MKDSVASPEIVTTNVDDQRRPIGTIQRNGRSPNIGSSGGETSIATTLPFMHGQSKSAYHGSAAAQIDLDKTLTPSNERNIPDSTSIAKPATAIIPIQTLNQKTLVQANKTIVALSVLIQHLTSDVSVFRNLSYICSSQLALTAFD